MKRNYAEIEINPVRCTGCAMCVAVCPEDVLAVKRLDGRPCAVTVWSARCRGCGSCVVTCPRDAIEIELFNILPALG